MQVSPETPATADSEESDKSSDKKKSSSLKNSSKSASTDLEEGQGGEVKEEESSVRRFLRWTAEDVFDWNPQYVLTVRGSLTHCHILMSTMVMTLVGSGCSGGPIDLDNTTAINLFYCHSSAAFMFVVACSAFIYSTLLLVCCLLSKKGDVIINRTVLELVYYTVYGIFYLFAGVALEFNLPPKGEGYITMLSGGVFGLVNSILYFISAVWSYRYFRKHFVDQDGK